jgi:hypothetical protein
LQLIHKKTGYFASKKRSSIFSRCFQLMECDDPHLFQQWSAHWQDLVEFEIVPVLSSMEATDAANSMTRDD